MRTLESLWEELKTLLHSPVSLKPLWEEMIAKIHELESRVASLEGYQAAANTPASPAPTEPAPTEQVINPDTPAATSANDSGGAGDPPATPSGNPSPEKLPDQNALESVVETPAPTH